MNNIKQFPTSKMLNSRTMAAAKDILKLDDEQYALLQSYVADKNRGEAATAILEGMHELVLLRESIVQEEKELEKELKKT